MSPLLIAPLTDSEEDEDDSAINTSHGGAASGSAAAWGRHRMPVCRLNFSPADSPKGAGALQGRRSDATASSDAHGDDERFQDTDLAVSLACSEELEEIMSPAASLRQPFSPISKLTGALHNMNLQVLPDMLYVCSALLWPFQPCSHYLMRSMCSVITSP